MTRLGSTCRIGSLDLDLHGTRNWSSASGADRSCAGDTAEGLCKDLCQGRRTTGGSFRSVLLLNLLQVVFNIVPASDHNEADDLPAFLGIRGHHCCVDLRDQLENGLDPFVGQEGFTVLDLAELGIGKHDLHDRFEDVAFAVHLFFDQLIHSPHFRKLVVTHCSQGEPQYTRKLI